jgi:hypothetical protein
MKKVKYEKPIVRKLGYENGVRGYDCVSGGGFKTSSCGGGNKAALCSVGGNFQIACGTGPSPTS